MFPGFVNEGGKFFYGGHKKMAVCRVCGGFYRPICRELLGYYD